MDKINDLKNISIEELKKRSKLLQKEIHQKENFEEKIILLELWTLINAEIISRWGEKNKC